ncbi:MAG: hypothetical protein KDB05_24040, partial [Planctomycetales bacterium]|nr:hypothetical protein [Planctomycetales bacterium]
MDFASLDTSDFLSPGFCIRFAMTLLHFVWQGCLGSVAVLCIGWLLRSASARVRYAFYVAVLFGMVACLPITYAILSVPPQETIALASVGHTNHSADADSRTTVLPTQITPLSNAELESNSISQSVADYSESTSPTSDHVSSSWAVILAPLATIVYASGVTIMLLRLVIALWGGRRLKQSASAVVDRGVLDVLMTQASRIGLKVVPCVAYCERVSVPVVVGILKPTILLPASFATGLATDQLEAIFLHELAHIHRFDLLMNLAQRVIESVLFFHPAVWYISRRISDERENCCDDFVVRSGCERLRYANALIRMAELCGKFSGLEDAPPLSTLAATGDRPSLFKRRVMRLINGEPNVRLTRGGMICTIAMLLLVGSPVAVQHLLVYATADEMSSATTETDVLSTTGRIVGQLVGENRLPDAAHAVVFLGDAQTGAPILKTSNKPLDLQSPGEDWIYDVSYVVTDEAGRFAFKELPPGRYRLMAQSWQDTKGIPWLDPKASKGPFGKTSTTVNLLGVADDVEVKADASTEVNVRKIGSGVLKIVNDPEEAAAFLFVSRQRPIGDPILSWLGWGEKFLPGLIAVTHMSEPYATLTGLPDDKDVHVALFNYDNNPGVGGGSYRVGNKAEVKLPILASWSNGKDDPPEELLKLVEHMEEKLLAISPLVGLAGEDYRNWNQLRDLVKQDPDRAINVEGVGEFRLIDVLAASRYRDLRNRHRAMRGTGGVKLPQEDVIVADAVDGDAALDDEDQPLRTPWIVTGRVTDDDGKLSFANVPAGFDWWFEVNLGERRYARSLPLRFTTGNYELMLRQNIEDFTGHDVMELTSVIDALGNPDINDVISDDPYFRVPLGEVQQEQGRDILRKVRLANQYWLARPPEDVKSYSYEFTLRGKDSQLIAISNPAAGSLNERRGISYYSAIDYITANPDKAIFRVVDVGDEKIELVYSLPERVVVSAGNGVARTWSGFFSMGVREGTLIIDAKTYTPIEHRTGELTEAFSNYVELRDGH